MEESKKLCIYDNPRCNNYACKNKHKNYKTRNSAIILIKILINYLDSGTSSLIVSYISNSKIILMFDLKIWCKNANNCIRRGCMFKHSYESKCRKISHKKMKRINRRIKKIENNVVD